MSSGTRRQRDSGRRRQRAQARARHVGDDPVERAGAPRGPGPVGDHDTSARGRGGHQAGPVRPQLGGDQPGACPGRQAIEQPRLAAGPGAQVQPPGVGAVDGTRVSAIAASWLASSCTPRPALGHGGDLGGVALGQVRAEPRPAGRDGARVGQLARRGPAGNRAQV